MLHLPAVMGVIMRTWHLLDIKKHITLSGLSPVYLLTAIWMMLHDGAKESPFVKPPVTGFYPPRRSTVAFRAVMVSEATVTCAGTVPDGSAEYIYTR